MVKVLITGVKGFAGRTIARQLKAKHEVIGCDRFVPKDADGYRFIQWDIGCGEEPGELAGENIDYIIHAAASLENDNLSSRLISTNCLGTLNVLKAAVAHSVKSVIYVSSLPVVGNSHAVPITETAVILPSTLYHATKAAGEFIISQAEHYGVGAVSLRVPSLIGPGMPGNTIVPFFIQKALRSEEIQIMGKGTRKQNYLDVRDLACVIERILKKRDMNGIFNIGAKNVMSNAELAQLCCKTLESRSKIIFSGTDSNDSVSWITDDSKLKYEIGDYQKINMKDSVLDIANEMKLL